MRRPGVALLSAATLGLCTCVATIGELERDGVPLPDAGREDVTDSGAAGGGGHTFDGGGDAGSNEDSGSVDGGQGDAGPVDAGVVVLYAYVGSGNGNVTVYRVDAGSGALVQQSTTNAGNNPSFLAFTPDGRFLYAVNEQGQNGQVASFSVAGATGALTFLNRVPSQGAGPTHVAVDRSGRWVMVANYGGGTAAVLPIRNDGSLGQAVDTESPGMQAHQIVTDPSNRFAFVPCLGSNWVAQYLFDADAGTLTANAVPRVNSAAGAGPRHMAFHPSGRFAYVINELNSTMTAYAFDGDAGTLSPIQTLSTLPAGFTGGNTCAEVEVHPSGRWLYGSNRGHNSIVIFGLDQATGQMTLLGHAATGGNTPRHFSLAANGTLLYVANQGSGTIHAFRVDPNTGDLQPLGQVATANAPAFVGVLPVRQ